MIFTNKQELQMQFKWHHLGGLFKNTFKSWVKKDPFEQSAVIAYYAIFSIPGLLVLVIAAAGFFLWKRCCHRGFNGTAFNNYGS